MNTIKRGILSRFTEYPPRMPSASDNQNFERNFLLSVQWIGADSSPRTEHAALDMMRGHLEYRVLD